MTNRQQLREVKQLVGIIFSMLEDYSDEEVAKKTGLGESTVFQIRTNYRGYISHRMQFRTLELLANAAGLKLGMGTAGTTVSLMENAA